MDIGETNHDRNELDTWRESKHVQQVEKERVKKKGTQTARELSLPFSLCDLHYVLRVQLMFIKSHLEKEIAQVGMKELI